MKGIEVIELKICNDEEFEIETSGDIAMTKVLLGL